MKAGILFVAALFIIAGCKKTHNQNYCGACPCLNADSITYADTSIDSASFYHSILGTWYIMRRDSILAGACAVNCVCDTQHQYYVVFLPNDSVIVNLPGSALNTYPYTFGAFNGMVNPQGGYYFISGTGGGFCLIGYGGNYLALSPPTISPGTLQYAPNYFLTRH